MASKFKFGMASGIPERRVRPIWDAVDSRQFKAALKLSTALLAKYPSSPYALALKALILERMGKPDEALSTCLNATEKLHSDESTPIDDLTLSTLQIVFQRLDRLDLATSCYEYACGKYPNNLELMMGLFNCYVREYSFVKQQQAAIKMYKVVGEERFLLWTVCSIQLQVSCGDGGDKLLVLAEGLLKKHVASHSLHEPEALLVYISILEQQAKYGAAIEILSGKLGSLIAIEVDRFRMQGRLLARACDYAAAAEIFQKVLESCPDDWECFLNYLGCLLEDDSSWCGGTIEDQIYPSKFINCKLSHLTNEVFDSRISKASCFVEKLLEEANNDSIRCPYLATLEIERRKHLYGKGDDVKIKEDLLNYFCRFGHLPCFTSDVEMFLELLTDDERIEFLEKITRSCDSSSVPIKALGQSITIFKLQELFGAMFKLPIGEVEGIAVQMTKIYCKNLPLSKDLDIQENMYGEELLSMACNVLVQLFWRTRNIDYLLESIMVLEFGLTIRRYVWQYKILLVHLYSLLNALPLAYEWYKTLEIKNILLETISHHILPQMLMSPLWVDLADLLKDYLKFMDDHLRESADLTFLAYRHRNYSKVIEFVQFKERLEHSNQYLMARLEAPILHLKQKAQNIEEEECILESLSFGVRLLELSNYDGCKSLTFNEDIQSRPWWTLTPDKNYLLGPFEGGSFCHKKDLWQQQLTKEKEEDTCKIFERRSLLPRMIYLSIHCASFLKENVEANDSMPDNKSFSELKSLLERYAKSLGFPFGDALEEIVAIAEGRKSCEVFNLETVDWMNFAVFLNAWNWGSHELDLPDKERCLPNLWHIVDSMIERCTLGKLRSLQPIIRSPGGNLSVLVQIVTEPLAWHGLVVQSCVRSMLPSGKRKKKSGTADQLNSALSQVVRGSIQSMHDVIEEVSKWLREQIDRPQDENLDTLLSPLLQKKALNEGPGQVLQILEALASTDDLEIGDRISQALRSWSALDVGRKILASQSSVLSEFLILCESKLKLLQTLKQQL